MQELPTFTITYHFDFKDGKRRIYLLELDSANLSLKSNTQTTTAPPDWARREHHPCSNCPLASSGNLYCPIATNLAHLIDHFKHDYSTDPVTVTVITPERTYLKETRVQYGLFSILGVIMATSGCPVLNFLKPMARFHLPFASEMETTIRSVSFYLLRQYFAARQGNIPDFELQGLQHRYADILKVNEGILARIRSAQNTGNTARSGDAQDNALLILHSLSQILTYEISDNLNSFEYLFKEE